MLISRVSDYSGERTERNLPITESQIQLYEGNKVLIQNVFPNLSVGDREFFKTGITEQKWDKMCKDE
jgi:hypothetical protein